MSEESFGAISVSTEAPSVAEEIVNTSPRETALRAGEDQSSAVDEELAAQTANEDTGNESDDSNEDQLQKMINEEKEKQELDFKFSTKFAALSRKERELKKKEAEIEARLNSLGNNEAESAASLERKILSNPLAWLEEKGYNFDKIT